MTEITRLTPGKARWEHDGDSVECRISESAVKLQAFAGRHGLNLQELVREAMETGAAPSRGPFQIRVRPTLSPTESARVTEGARPAAAFFKALEDYADEYSVMTWQGTDRLAVLDIDYHGGYRPPKPFLSVLGLSLRPTPVAWWISHGGGIHALYTETPGLRADEVASAAAISLLEVCPRATVEVLPSTTHPLCPRERDGKVQTAGKLHKAAQDLTGMLSAWRGSDDESEVPEEDIDQWLEARGMQRGGRHPHELCPFDPCPGTGQPPVVVTEDGVLCYRCKGTGHRSGGFSPFSSLVHGRTIPRILEAARNFVPWEHTRFVVEEDYGSRAGLDVLKRAYIALASLVHGESDPRVQRLRLKYHCIRGDSGVWLDPESLNPISPAPKVGRLQMLPSCRRAWLDEEKGWQEKVDPVLLDKHSTNQLLEGYPEILAIRGVKLWGQYLRYGDRNKVRAVVTPLEARQNPPRYLTPDLRTPEDECEGWLTEHFPGIDLKYLKLLLVARGYAESGVGMVPLLLVSGPTGSGKTSTADLAAAMLGDKSVTVPKGNYQETLGYKLREGGIIILDEFGKGSTGENVRALFDFLLEVRRRFSYRRLHVGPVEDFITSALVVTNNTFPAEVVCHEQVARRAIWVPLGNSAPEDWQETCGMQDLRLLRNEVGPAKVADSFLSSVVDEFFVDDSLTFFRAAEALGYSRVRDSAAREELNGMAGPDQVRDFFDMVVLADDAEGARYEGRGWKCLDLSDAGDTTVLAWKDLANDDMSDSIAIKEQDLNKALGVPVSVGSIRFVCRKSGRKVYMKFQLDYAEGGRHNYACNGDIQKHREGE